MSSTTEVHAAQIIANIEGGVYPREAVLTIARGFLPLPQDDLIAVLAFLASSPDAEIRQLAHDSIVDVPIKAMITFAANENVESKHLELLVRASEDVTVLETLIRNRSVSDDAIVVLARIAPPPVQDIIVINQARIIRAPQILDALLENPSLSADARRRTLENREEFFDKKERIRALQEEFGVEVVADIPMDPIEDLLVQAEADQSTDTTVPTLPPEVIEDELGVSIWSQILKMNVSQKVQLAFKGNKTVRMILIRERNRLVASATMRNPRMTENEVEQISGMRNVEEEVLRLIGSRRDWTSKYPIALALIKNPKAPLGVVLPLINRLTLRDLKGLKDDKGVSEAVRVNARKFYQSKQKQ